MNFNLLSPREKVSEIIGRIYKYSLTTTSGGNVSFCDKNGSVFITPGGNDKGVLTPDDIMEITKDGEFIGKHKPSCEYPFHTSVYKRRPEIKAIIHAHAPSLVAFAVVRKIPNTSVMRVFKDIFDKIAPSAYAIPGSLLLGDIIAQEFYNGFDVVMMDNHSVVIGAADLQTAYLIYEALDLCAKILINAAFLGGKMQEIDEKTHIFDINIAKKQGNQRDYNENEVKIANEIISFIKRSLAQHIINSVTGVFSAKISDTEFIISPSEMDREYISIDDLMIVNINNDNKINKIVDLHKNIYKKNNEINAIFMSQGPYSSAFGITNTQLDCRIIPESYVMIHDIKTVKYDKNFIYNNIINQIGKINPVIMAENDFAICVGKDLTQVFDRMEVLEFSANSLISATKLGKIINLNQNEIDDINKNFINW